MTPMEVLEADPNLVQELLEVARCDAVVRTLGEDLSKLTKADYSLLLEMGWNSDGDVPEETIDRPDERWLLG